MSNMSTDTTNDLQRINLATLAHWAESASGGFFTVDPEQPLDRYVSISRKDGERMGTFLGNPVNTYGIDVYVPPWRLTRRNRLAMRGIYEAVRHLLYAQRSRETEMFGEARAALGIDPDGHYPGEVAMALYEFQRRNHLENVKR